MHPGRRIARLSAAGLIVVLWLGGCVDGSGPGRCSGDVVEVGFDEESPVTLRRIPEATYLVPDFSNECGWSVSVDPSRVTWSSTDPAVATVRQVTGAREPRGYVEAVSFGGTEVSAEAEGVRGEIVVVVVNPETDGSGFTVLGSGEAGLATKDLWVHGDFAYTGSGPWSCDGSSEPPCESLDGWLYVWSLLSDGGISKVDSVALPALRVNDIKVSADGTFAVASQERGGEEANGIVLLDLADPAAPARIAHYTTGLEGGVHNVWIERLEGRDYVFVVEDGTGEEAGLHVLDVTDRASPLEVAHYVGGSSFAHDVYVRDGLAFVSHWDDGLVILDVGNGILSGSPDNPVEVGRVEIDGGNTHNAWYWPQADLVFVGQELFPPPDQPGPHGVLHVVDASDLTNPVEVARFGVEGETPHNFWLDEDREILYAAWYTNGLRAIDVSGDLSGDLAAQGRELGYVIPSGPNGAASVWAPQLHDGRIYLSDVYNGIWSVRFDG